MFASPRLLGASAVALAGSIVAVALFTGTAHAQQISLPARSAPVAAHPAVLKAPVSGLLDRHHTPATGYQSVVRSYVVDTTWASLQPEQGGPIVHPNDIDVAIAAARAQGMTLGLRVRAGIDAPEWAKNLDGAPMVFHYTDASVAMDGKVAGTVGRFWTPEYAAAYADLQFKLAALYDRVPEIRQTDITQCSTIFGETYLRDAEDPRNVRALTDAGFTRALDDACHISQLNAHRPWHHTASALSMNPYQWIRPGKVGPDMPYTIAQMALCRQMLGARCLLANHSLSVDRIDHAGLYPELYAAMLASGAPITLQTSTYMKIGDLEEVLTWAGAHGVQSVELPTGYDNDPLGIFTAAAGSLGTGTATPPGPSVAASPSGTSGLGVSPRQGLRTLPGRQLFGH